MRERDKPGSVPLRGLIIYLGRLSPGASSGQPGDASEPGKLFLLSDLAPGGVYLAAGVTTSTGALLPHRFTLTKGRLPPWRSALCCTCRRLTRPGVTWHPALRSPDFPQPYGRDQLPLTAILIVAQRPISWTPEKAQVGFPPALRCCKEVEATGCGSR